VRVYRNLDAAFEREIESHPPQRYVRVDLDVTVKGAFVIDVKATTEDGRTVVSSFSADVEKAQNRERAQAMLEGQLGKRSGEYEFAVRSLTAPGALPLLSAGTINSMRRCVASDIPLWHSGCASSSGQTAEGTSAQSKVTKDPLMRTKYCIKYELGLCSRHQGAAPTGPLFLINNGRRLALGFDCAACEMTVNRT
jgi:putative protease